MRNKSLIALLLLTGLIAACNTNGGNEPVTPAPAMTPVASPTMAPRTVANTSTVENRDGSTTVVTHYSDGTKSEVRTFKTGRLARVTRETNATGQRTARVTYRDTAREVELRDESWIDKSMDATGNALVEVADKLEDAGDMTKKGVKEGVKEVGDKAEDVGDAVKKGAKKVTKKAKEIVP
jgi:hypothetical protein